MFKKMNFFIRVLLLFIPLNVLAESDLEKLLVNKNYQQFFTEAQSLKNDNDALFLLGKAYHLGLGTAVDINKAKQLYLSASTLGNARADHNLGLILFSEGKREEGLKYLKKALERGLEEPTIFNLARLYREIINEIYSSGNISLYRVKTAQYIFSEYLVYQRLLYQQQPTLYNLEELAKAYLHIFLYVERTEESLANATKWLDKAITEGSVNALFNKGVMYQAQDNKEKAIEWFKKAAEKKQPLAGQLLGSMTLGTESLLWYGSAMGLGNLEAAEKVSSILSYPDEVARRLSKEELNILIQEAKSFLDIQTEIYQQKLMAQKQQNNTTEKFISNKGEDLYKKIIRQLNIYMDIVLMFENAKKSPLKLTNEKVYFNIRLTDIPGEYGFPLIDTPWKISAISSHTENSSDIFLRNYLIEGKTDDNGKVVFDKDYSDVLRVSLVKGDILIFTYPGQYLYLKPVLRKDGVYLVPNEIVNKRIN